MWENQKTQRLRILTILAGITYAFLVISSFVDGLDNFKEGVEAGSQNGLHDTSGKILNNHPVENLYLSFRPKNGFKSYPDSLVNQTSGQTIKTKLNHAVVHIPSASNESTTVYSVFKFLFGLIIIITYIFIPIHFYRLIGSLKKDYVFEKKNIRLLRWLGFELMTIYFGSILLNFMNYKINCALVSLADYEIVIDCMDGIWLLFGIVVLLIAEILSKALVLKEEQELTI
jgi:hypothetical protein